VAAFLANIGANASHTVRSRLATDGSFELMPIPERERWRPPMLRFDALGRDIPKTWRRRAMHLDPDLTCAVPTYGDNCRLAGRAFSLRSAKRGDLIVFVARLHPEGAAPGFYLVGRLEVDECLADVTADPGPGWWDGNAHIRRARATGRWDSFWVFKGTRMTHQFKRAHRFGRLEAANVFGDVWTWPPHRTELQTIASYTRAVRRVEGEGEAWLRSLCPT
jgi:hypothetical protein